MQNPLKLISLIFAFAQRRPDSKNIFAPSFYYFSIPIKSINDSQIFDHQAIFACKEIQSKIQKIISWFYKT